jgi:hypothetical protein
MEKTYIIDRSYGGTVFPIIANHFDALVWLFKARSNDPKRENLRHFHIENGIYFATDGMRMHVYTPEIPEELPKRPEFFPEDGNYEVVSCTKKQIVFRTAQEDFVYPDCWRVLSYRPTNGIPTFNGSSYRDGLRDFGRFVYHVYRHQAREFNLNYLEDAFMKDCDIKFERHSNSDIGPLIMGNENRFAVVMPLKN